MNYKKPLQRQSTLRWDYTCSNNRTGTYAIGYCAGWREWSEEDIERFYGGRESSRFLKEEQLREATRHKYHTDGHATYEEAIECYRQYELDNRLRLDGKESGAQHQCKVCGTWTQRFAEVGMQMWTLCDEHCTREEVEKLFQGGESFGSY